MKLAGIEGFEKYNSFKTLIRGGRSDFMEESMSKDPYSYINKKTHKIEINAGYPYRSTSLDDIFEIRN